MPMISRIAAKGNTKTREPLRNYDNATIIATVQQGTRTPRTSTMCGCTRATAAAASLHVTRFAHKTGTDWIQVRSRVAHQYDVRLHTRHSRIGSLKRDQVPAAAPTASLPSGTEGNSHLCRRIALRTDILNSHRWGGGRMQKAPALPVRRAVMQAEAAII